MNLVETHRLAHSLRRFHPVVHLEPNLYMKTRSDHSIPSYNANNVFSEQASKLNELNPALDWPYLLVSTQLSHDYYEDFGLP